MTSARFTFRGDTLAYSRTGTGPPILFLHNGGSAKEIWTRQVEVLRQRYEVICLDHLGYGESDMPERGYTIDQHVERLSAFIEHLGHERISVVGNCMGSAMALLLADRRPELFDSLVLINPLSKNTARRGVLGWLLPLVSRFPTLSMAISRRVRIPQALTNIVITVQFGPRNWLRGIRAPRPGTAQAGKGWSVRGRLAALAEMFAIKPRSAPWTRSAPARIFPRSP